MWWPAQGHDGRDSQPFSYRTTRFNSYTTKHEVKMRNNWWLFLLVQLRAAPINDLDEGVFKRRLCLTWLRLQQSMNRKRKNVGHLISLQSTRHIPIAAEVERPESRSEGHAEYFSRFHQVLHHLFFLSAIVVSCMKLVSAVLAPLQKHGKCQVQDFFVRRLKAWILNTVSAISFSSMVIVAIKLDARVKPIWRARKGCVRYLPCSCLCSCWSARGSGCLRASRRWTRRRPGPDPSAVQDTDAMCSSSSVT